MNHYIYYIAIFTLGSFIAPIIAARLHISAVIIELLYGIILGFTLDKIDFINHGEIIHYFSELGFMFLFFLAGMEINFDGWRWAKLKLPLYALILFYGMAFSLWHLYLSNTSPFTIVLLTASSIGVLFLTLRTNHLEKTEYGQVLIWSESIAEIASIVVLIMYGSYAQDSHNIQKAISIAIGKLILLVIILYFLIQVLFRYFWKYPVLLTIIDNSNSTFNRSELNIRFLILILFSILSLTTLFDFKPILGSFLSGIVIAILFKDKHSFEKKISSVGYGFIIPFFFIKVGYDFSVNLDDFQIIFKEACVLYCLIFIARSCLALPVIPLFKDEALQIKIRNVIASAFALSAPFTLLVTAGKMGYNMQLITMSQYKATVLCAMISGLIGPILFSLVYKKSIKT